jgi:hypothetical protein
MWLAIILLLILLLLLGWWFNRQNKCRYPYKICDTNFQGHPTCPKNTQAFKNDKGVGCLPLQTCPQRRQDTGCAKVYQPVCGFTSAGYTTYPNACEACSDPQVTTWTPGMCETYFPTRGLGLDA